jgi:hypothetical protein
VLSRSTEKLDRDEKLPYYAEHGVRHEQPHPIDGADEGSRRPLLQQFTGGPERCYR